MRQTIDAAAFQQMVIHAAAAISVEKQQVNDLNVFPVPDGDTGTNMSLTMGAAAAELKKRDFRQLWITRISAACKLNGMNYSTFMNGLKKAGIAINRKMLAEMAVNDKAAFTQLTETAKKALA